MESSWGQYGQIAFTLAIIPCALVYLLYTSQDSMLYMNKFPEGSKGKLEDTPSKIGLRYEDVYLTTKDGVKIHSWFIPVKAVYGIKSNEAPTVLFFHENAGNIAHRLFNIDKMQVALKCNIFIVSYRGYGISEGEPSETGLKLDSEAAFEHLLTMAKAGSINKTKIIVFGRSLGGAVAAHIASKYQEHIYGLVLENTFTSVPSMLEHMPFPISIAKHLTWLCRNKWTTLDIVKSLNRVPVLFLSGLKDEIVPSFMMRSLYDACASSKKSIQTFANGTHNESLLQMGYWDSFAEFVASLEDK